MPSALGMTRSLDPEEWQVWANWLSASLDNRTAEAVAGDDEGRAASDSIPLVVLASR